MVGKLRPDNPMSNVLRTAKHTIKTTGHLTVIVFFVSLLAMVASLTVPGKIRVILSNPIDTSNIHLVHGEFRPSVSGEYNIVVELDKSSSITRAKCLIGIYDSVYPDCVGISSSFNIYWILSKSGVNISSGDSLLNRGGGYSKSSVSRYLGVVSLTKSQLYSIDIFQYKAVEEIARYSPHIKLELRENPENEIIGRIIMSLMLMIFTGVSGARLLIGVFRR